MPKTASSSASSARKAFKSKDASHLGFYAQFLRGLGAGVGGTALVLANRDLRTLMKGFARPVMLSNAALLLVALAIYFFSDEDSDHQVSLYLILMRYSRVVATTLLVFLDRTASTRTEIFTASLRLSSPETADRFDQIPKSKYKQPFARRVARIARLLLVRFLSISIVRRFLPMPVLAAIKFVSLRSILGDAGSLVTAVLSTLPTEFLSGSFVDEVFLGVVEAITDSFSLSKDAIRPYLKKVGSDLATREYLLSRYRGYLVGMGFFYSMLMEVPFLGVPAILLAHASAAIQLTRILERNATKEDENYRPLPGEPRRTSLADDKTQ